MKQLAYSELTKRIYFLPDGIMTKGRKVDITDDVNEIIKFKLASTPPEGKGYSLDRPNIKDFFGQDATLPIVMKIYEYQPELFKYAQALDNYIDELASLPPQPVKQQC